MTELVLARHGQTDWNLEGRYAGQADVPLNAAGINQAQSLAQRLNGRRFTAIYSSDLQRARQTAEILAQRLKLPLKLDPRLREINQGQWEGELFTVLVERYAAEMTERRRNPIHAHPPGGESVAEVARRVIQAADDIARAHPQGSVLLVAHGITLAVLICQSQRIPLSEVYHNIPENADPVVIVWLPGRYPLIEDGQIEG